jgi:hypothetical protein
MNKQVVAISIALFLSVGAAHAQSTTITTGAAPSVTVTVEPEYRERIKSYVIENHVRPVESRERIVIGTTVPEEVELRAVPSDWGPSVARYRYVYSDNHVMLVEPSSRKVVQIVE